MSPATTLALAPSTSKIPEYVLALTRPMRTKNSQPFLSAAAACTTRTHVSFAPLTVALRSMMRSPLSPEPSNMAGAVGVPKTVMFPVSVLTLFPSACPMRAL